MQRSFGEATDWLAAFDRARCVHQERAGFFERGILSWRGFLLIAKIECRREAVKDASEGLKRLIMLNDGE